MKLCLESISDAESCAHWTSAGVALPAYNVAESRAATKAAPRWLHFGVGNIFRIFLGGIADNLLASGSAGTGIICADTHGFDTIGKIYAPYDNLTLAVTLNADGSISKRVLASLAEALNADYANTAHWSRLKQVFAEPSLQLASFTITEKGYALKDSSGAYLPAAAADFASGVEKPRTAMGIVTALLYERFTHGATPIALVSMDNCSHNGEKLENAVTEIAAVWQENGFVSKDFCMWLADRSKVSFPWTMIDKITPRPAQPVSDKLSVLGIEDMQVQVTAHGSYIAPFVNAEAPQYLVIEDDFPNGRPLFEQADAGVYMTDRATVNAVERMKVTACLNPLHTALAVFGCLLGYKSIAAEMQDKDLARLAHRVAREGMEVVTDPGIIRPAAFASEVLEVRLPNRYLPDTPQRIATDTSQKVGIRYGETLKSYIAHGNAADAGCGVASLRAIPLALAGWLRYLLAVDDTGAQFTPSADPLLSELQAALSGITLGTPESAAGKLHPILSNERIFGCDLYAAGLGPRIEALFCDMLSGPGAVRRTLQRALP